MVLGTFPLVETLALISLKDGTVLYSPVREDTLFTIDVPGECRVGINSRGLKAKS